MKYTQITNQLINQISTADNILNELQKWLNHGHVRQDKNDINSKIVTSINAWQSNVEKKFDENGFIIEKLKFRNILHGHFQYIYPVIGNENKDAFSNQVDIIKRAKDELLNVCEKLEAKNDKKTITQIYIDNIDNFKNLTDKVKAMDIAPKYTKSVFLEDDVEETFLDILCEPYKELDSGAEMRDLYTDKVLINGKRIASAWMFKGRSVKGPLKIKGCGKNADQLLKLSKNTFAQLFVVQHGHKIEPEVIEALRDHLLAHSLSHDIKILIIDGIETARILKAKGKDLDALMNKKKACKNIQKNCN